MLPFLFSVAVAVYTTVIAIRSLNLSWYSLVLLPLIVCAASYRFFEFLDRRLTARAVGTAILVVGSVAGLLTFGYRYLTGYWVHFTIAGAALCLIAVFIPEGERRRRPRTAFGAIAHAMSARITRFVLRTETVTTRVETEAIKAGNQRSEHARDQYKWERVLGPTGRARIEEDAADTNAEADFFDAMGRREKARAAAAAAGVPPPAPPPPPEKPRPRSSREVNEEIDRVESERDEYMSRTPSQEKKMRIANAYAHRLEQLYKELRQCTS